MNQDRAVQVWNDAKIEYTKYIGLARNRNAVAIIAAYGQERYRAGVEDSYEAARKAWPTALRECQANEILDAIYNLPAEQEKKG